MAGAWHLTLRPSSVVCPYEAHTVNIVPVINELELGCVVCLLAVFHQCPTCDFTPLRPSTAYCVLNMTNIEHQRNQWGSDTGYTPPERARKSVTTLNEDATSER